MLCCKITATKFYRLELTNPENCIDLRYVHGKLCFKLLIDNYEQGLIFSKDFSYSHLKTATLGFFTEENTNFVKVVF